MVIRTITRVWLAATTALNIEKFEHRVFMLEQEKPSLQCIVFGMFYKRPFSNGLKREWSLVLERD